MNSTFQETRSQPGQPSLSTAVGTKIPAVVHDVLRSPGQPLDSATRSFMEPRFGHNFGNVRVHHDAKAAESARAMNAQAYTVGRHIFFREPCYSKNLLAHELAHTIQQRDAKGDAPEANKDLTLELEARQAAAETEHGVLASRLRGLQVKAIQMQPDAGTSDREAQLWNELGIDLLLEELRLKLEDNQFPHPDTIYSGKGMTTPGTVQVGGDTYDTSKVEYKLHTYTWDWTHSSLRLDAPEKLTHKELAYLYYWYGDETRQIQQALEKLAATIKDEQRRKELQEVAAYFKATERFVIVTFGASAAGGAVLAAGGATALGTGARWLGTGVRAGATSLRTAATGLGETATSQYVRANLATRAATTAAGGAAAKIGTEILTNPAVQWAGQNPNVATGAVETAATSGPKILEGTYTKEDALFDILTLAQARGADISLGTSGSSVDVGEAELTPSIRQPASTTEAPPPAPPPRSPGKTTEVSPLPPVAQPPAQTIKPSPPPPPAAAPKSPSRGPRELTAQPKSAPRTSLGIPVEEDLEAGFIQPAGKRAAGMAEKPQHHIFPRELEKQGFWQARGFAPNEVDQYCVELPEFEHQAQHGGGNPWLGREWKREWNSDITLRILEAEQQLGRTLTKQEVLDIGKQMQKDRGIDLPYVKWRGRGRGK